MTILIDCLFADRKKGGDRSIRFFLSFLFWERKRFPFVRILKMVMAVQRCLVLCTLCRDE